VADSGRLGGLRHKDRATRAMELLGYRHRQTECKTKENRTAKWEAFNICEHH